LRVDRSDREPHTTATEGIGEQDRERRRSAPASFAKLALGDIGAVLASVERELANRPVRRVAGRG
jgi:hypothetical protein